MPWYFYGKNGSLVTPRPAGILPTGAIVPSPLPYTATPPDGYLFCDGQSVSKNPLDTVNYIDLFAVVGNIFGSVDVNHFNVPDFRTRMPRGIINFAGGIGSVSGVGGSKNHTHSVGTHDHPMTLNHAHSFTAIHTHSFPSHSHALSAHVHSSAGSTVGGADARSGTDTVEVPPDPPGTPSVPASTDTNSTAGSHDHSNSLTGFTGGVHATQDAVDPTTPPTSGNESDNTLSTTNVSGTSGAAGGGTSTPVSQYPPYFTFSFLIKT